MKHRTKKITTAIAFLIMLFSFSSCYESHYYHHYNHHTREWYDRHHQSPPAGVDFNVDVRNW